MIEHYRTSPSANALFNSKYNVVFPHDSPNDHAKYIRRMERLRSLILDTHESICFVYVSTSSPTGPGAFTVDGEHVIKNIPFWIEKINTLLHTFRSNYKIYVLTTASDEEERVINDNVHYINMPRYNSWVEMLPHVVETFATIVSTMKE